MTSTPEALAVSAALARPATPGEPPATPATPAEAPPADPAARASVGRGGDDGSFPTPPRKHCGAGSSGIAVDPYGNVYPCVQWRRPVGNLHRQPIHDIWRSSRGLAEVRELTTAAKGVVEAYGAGGAFLNFCPGNAAALTGDPLRL